MTREEKERVLGVSCTGRHSAGGHVSVLTRQPRRAGLPLPVGSIHSFIQHPWVPGAGDECSSARDSWGPCPWPSQPRGQQGSTAGGAAWARRGLAFTRPRGAEWGLQPGPPAQGHAQATALPPSSPAGSCPSPDLPAASPIRCSFLSGAPARAVRTPRLSHLAFPSQCGCPSAEASAESGLGTTLPPGSTASVGSWGACGGGFYW